MFKIKFYIYRYNRYKMSKNLHEKPFDEATIAKLEIFEDYAQAWIPTFVMYGDPVICIFDFFAGTGYDKKGVPGSPIRILNKIKEQTENIFRKKIKIKVFFNEYDKAKCNLLRNACDEYLKSHPNVQIAVELSIINEDFKVAFFEFLPFIQEYPSLVYLDQNGIQFLASKYLLALEQTFRTDFLYFVSSSYFWRFGEKEEFRAYVELDMNLAKQNPYQFIHRSILEQLKTTLPIGSQLKLYPFSLKKGANIHGIIFGATHPRAVEKFLTIAWKRNESNGEANFDINDDEKKAQLSFFESKKLNKRESFQQKLRAKVLDGSIANNVDAYKFALDEGHIGSHASDELKRMKEEKLIHYLSNSPLVTYQKVYGSQNKLLEYKILKK